MYFDNNGDKLSSGESSEARLTVLPGTNPDAGKTIPNTGNNIATGALDRMDNIEAALGDVKYIMDNWEKDNPKEPIAKEDRFKEGELFAIKMSGAPIFDERGKLVAVLPNRIGKKDVAVQIFGTGRAIAVGKKVLLAIFIPVDDSGNYDQSIACKPLQNNLNDYREVRDAGTSSLQFREDSDPIVYIPEEYIRGKPEVPGVRVLDLSGDGSKDEKDG